MPTNQTAHHAGRVLDMDKVQLKILARDMQDAAGVFVCDLGQHIKLIRRQATAGTLMRCIPGACQRVSGPLTRSFRRTRAPGAFKAVEPRQPLS